MKDKAHLGLAGLWGSVGKGSAALASATIAGGAIVYLATPLVTHVFDPSALGDYGVYLAVVALLSPVATLNYVEAVALPVTDAEAWSLTRSVMANTTGFSLFVLAVLAVTFAGNAAGVWSVGVPVVMWVVPAGVFFAGAQATMLRWLVRQERYAPAVSARIGQGVTMAAGQPALGLATGMRTGGVGAVPLAAGDAISTAVGWLILVRGSVERSRWRELVGFRRDHAVLRRYRQFMTAGLPATELNTLTLRIPFLVMAAAYGTTVAGRFALVERLILTPVAVVTSAVDVVLVRQSALRADDPAAVRHLFHQTTVALALFGLPLLLLAAVDLGPLVARVFGHGWGPAAEMVRPLALLYFTDLVISPWGAAMAVAERQDLFLLREVVRLLLIGTVGIVVMAATPSVTTSVALIAGAAIVSYLWYWAVCSWALHHPRRAATLVSSAGGER